MKRRGLALALVLSLLLAMLCVAPLSSAEETPGAEIDAAAAVAETPELPEAEAAPAETPVAELPAGEEAFESETPEAETPEAETPEPEAPDAGPIVTPIGEVPAEELPAETPAAEIAPEETDAAPSPGETMAPPAAESNAQSIDPGSFDALGSDGVAYAGVHYLSQATFNRMDAEAQKTYIHMVDSLTDMLDDGIAIYHPVFSLEADGSLCFDYSIPWKVFSQDAPEASPQNPPEQIAEAEAPQEAEFAESKETAPEEAAPEAAPEDEGPVTENVELAKRWRVPLRHVPGQPASNPAPADGLRAGSMRFDTMYWDGRNLFYDQLSEESKEYYACAKTGILDEGNNGFQCEVDDFYYLVEHYDLLWDALSALKLSYPAQFEWMGLGTTTDEYGSVIPEGVHLHLNSSTGLELTIDVSKHYSADLEQRAQAKVAELRDAALAFARKKYPNDLAYGMVYYFDNWLCKHNYYNMKGADDSTNNTANFYYCHTSYGTLLQGSGVCESYALAMSRLLDAASIPNLYVTGRAGGNHAWNQIYMPDGKYYLQDTTWNDPVGVGLTGNTTRQYLLCANDGRHIADGQVFGGTEGFRYPALSKKKYAPNKKAPSAQPTPTVAPGTNWVRSIVLNRTVLALQPGERAELIATVLPQDANEREVVWSSSAESVATVENGLVQAISAGEARITCAAADGGGAAASCDVIVMEEKVPLVSYPAAELTLGKGEEAALPASSLVSEDFTYASSNEKIATVNQKGRIRAKAPGDAVITATGARSGESAQLRLTVAKAPGKVTLSATKQTLGAGESFELRATLPEGSASALTPKLSGGKYAQVAEVEPGVYRVTGLKKGTAKLTIRTFNGKSKTCKITVKKAPDSIRLMDGKSAVAEGVKFTLGVEEALKLTAKLPSGSAGRITWRSDNPEAAEVNDGQIVARDVGEAVISASVYNAGDAEAPHVASCRIEVLPAPAAEAMRLSLPQAALGVKDKITAEFHFDGCGGSYSFQSQRKKIATVNAATGEITAKAPGTTDILVKAYNGETVRVPLTVVAAPTKAKLTAEVRELQVGERLQLRAQVLVKKLDVTDSVRYWFRTDDVGLVQLNEQTGELIALAPGTARIELVTYNKKRASLTLAIR